MTGDLAPTRNLGGRPAATSAHELAEAAQRLFLANGFDETSIDDIATDVGISKRTFFRYFATKADVLWVESGVELARLEEQLRATPRNEPYRAAITHAVLAALHFPPEQREWALHRAQLIFTVPSVQAQAWVRFTEMRTIATRFIAQRYHQRDDDLFPLAVGHATLASSLTAHEYWIGHPDTELPDALERALSHLLPAEPQP